MSHLVATWQTEPLVWFVGELGGCGKPWKKILQDERLKQVLSGVQFREGRIIEGPPNLSENLTRARSLPGDRQHFEG